MRDVLFESEFGVCRLIDLRPHFKHLHWRPMLHSFGVDVASDWADKADDDPVFGLYKRCGLWTMDEVQILHECARRMPPGYWLDIGCHTGWTTLHIALAHGQLGKRGPARMDNLDCSYVVYIDPMLAVDEFHQRFRDNMPAHPDGTRHWTPGSPSPLTSSEYFASYSSSLPSFSGVCIDGDHSPGKPLEDAINSVKHLAERGVILFHDCTGRPVHEAVEYCISQGFSCKAYPTVHGVAACWRGDFMPPDFTMDPRCEPVVDRLGTLKRFV